MREERSLTAGEFASSISTAVGVVLGGVSRSCVAVGGLGGNKGSDCRDR